MEEIASTKKYIKSETTYDIEHFHPKWPFGFHLEEDVSEKEARSLIKRLRKAGHIIKCVKEKRDITERFNEV